MSVRRVLSYGLFGLALLASSPASARDAAFVEPGTITAKGNVGEALVADPKQYDAGESNVGIARRVTLFFANSGGNPISVSDVNVSGDGNVTVQMTANDCQKNEKLAGGSRCSVSLSITPTSAGPWGVEVLTTHDGSGRIARAVVSGKALQDAKNSGEGLNPNSKDIKPVDFGEVNVNSDPAVRTALMVNDSPEAITVMAIDLIAVSKGLEKLDHGCAPEQVLKPGESCPITLRWTPYGRTALMTDLIIRHTGKVGFTVIPVRGHTVGGAESAEEGAGRDGRLVKATRAGALAPPPTATEIEKLAVKVPPVAAQDVMPSNAAVRIAPDVDDVVYFIGQVGDRAILQHNGLTRVVALDNAVEIDGAQVRLLNIVDKVARVSINGRQRDLKLQPSGYRPLPSVKKDKAETDRIEAQNTTLSSNSQSSSGKQGVSANSSPSQGGALINGQ